MTPDQVATAIIAACRELGQSDLLAISVAAGERDTEQDCIAGTFPIARARLYAALALHEYFEVNRAEAARVVGVKPITAKSYLASRLGEHEGRGPLWFNRDIVGRVKAALATTEDSAKQVLVAAKVSQEFIAAKITLEKLSLAAIARARRNAPLGANVTAAVIDAKARGEGVQPTAASVKIGGVE